MNIILNPKNIWLYDLIKRRVYISFDAISDAWLDCSLNEYGRKLTRRTFENWKKKLREELGVIISPSSSGNFYIENDMELRNSSYAKWMIDTMMVNISLAKAINISNRILLPKVPSGQVYLETVIDAMKCNFKLEVTYHIYGSKESYSCIVHPYWVKFFEQRWYLIGYNESRCAIRIYGLDRVEGLCSTNKRFVYKQNLDGEEYFNDCYGIMRNMCEEDDVCYVRLYADPKDAFYLRDLPLHHSQKEIAFEDHSEFTMRVRPTFDFVQAILKQGPGVYVMEPTRLRDDIKRMIEKMRGRYQ